MKEDPVEAITSIIKRNAGADVIKRLRPLCDTIILDSTGLIANILSK